MAANRKPTKKAAKSSERFEPGKLDSLFVVLDAIAWMENATAGAIAQYAAIDRGSVGKLLKNAKKIHLIDSLGDGYILNRPYPFKGSLEAKKTVVRDALFRLPLLKSVRQFLGLGDNLAVALRKAATVNGIAPYTESDLMPLVDWARSLNALDPNMVIEDLLDQGEEAKAARHKSNATQRVAFLSHSSKDKPFIRQLAADLTANGISVWLDEQRIHVGDSIPERVAQGLAESDIFLVAISQHSVDSPWVRKELDRALVKEIESRKTEVLPMKLDSSEMPDSIKEKKYANFSASYKAGLDEVLEAIRSTRS